MSALPANNIDSGIINESFERWLRVGNSNTTTAATAAAATCALGSSSATTTATGGYQQQQQYLCDSGGNAATFLRLDQQLEADWDVDLEKCWLSTPPRAASPPLAASFDYNYHNNNISNPLISSTATTAAFASMIQQQPIGTPLLLHKKPGVADVADAATQTHNRDIETLKRLLTEAKGAFVDYRMQEKLASTHAHLAHVLFS